ncbi:MAG: DUF1015 domain-containing protein [Spirochaetia bacterium]|nr:DUF1015 domain-containing protein [Spirochaetia bacterium]
MNQNKGFTIPEILLPKENIDLTKWAVVACDQFSSEPAYWDSVEQIVGNAPSTLRLTYPEAYLETGSKEARIETINRTMNEYLNNGMFRNIGKGIIYIERTFSDKKKAPRKGLILAVDLEYYDFQKGSVSLIRATEGTIQERIPPRVAIRKNAPIEFPHILILIDDRENRVMKAVEKAAKSVVYDFDLMKNSGHLRGSFLSNPQDTDAVCEALNTLADKEAFRNRYGSDDVLLFAVGDGNHSLATAKTLWETRKPSLTAAERETDPARYALVEINNIYDDGIVFEPIHRVLFDADTEKLKTAFAQEAGVRWTPCTADAAALERFAENVTDKQKFYLFDKNNCWEASVDTPLSTITAGTVQTVLDAFLKKENGKIDYIHGIASTLTLGRQPHNIGIVLPNIAKEEFFETVIRDGAFPRKTFSMGEATEKRFYMEGKLIK